MKPLTSLSIAALVAAVVATGAPARSQTAPAAGAAAASPAPWGMRGARGPARPGMRKAPDMTRHALMTLRLAYDAFGHAQAAGIGGEYLASAKGHYEAALARYAKKDAAGAAGEARASMAYLHLAMSVKGRPVPSGITAPPSPPAETTRPDMAASRAYAMLSRNTRAAALLPKVAALGASDESTKLANAAAAAESSAEKAAAAKNYGDVEKQARLASALGRTLVAVVAIDHEKELRALMPPRGRGMMGRPGMGGMHPGMGGPGGPGGMHGPGGMRGPGMGGPGTVGMTDGPAFGGPDEDFGPPDDMMGFFDGPDDDMGPPERG